MKNPDRFHSKIITRSFVHRVYTIIWLRLCCSTRAVESHALPNTCIESLSRKLWKRQETFLSFLSYLSCYQHSHQGYWVIQLGTGVGLHNQLASPYTKNHYTTAYREHSIGKIFLVMSFDTIGRIMHISLFIHSFQSVSAKFINQRTDTCISLRIHYSHCGNLTVFCTVLWGNPYNLYILSW